MTVVVYVININKDSFSYTVRRSGGVRKPGTNDKLNWVAIADE